MSKVDDWQKQWSDALDGARSGLQVYEQIARTLGIDVDNKVQADTALAIAVVHTAMLSGLPVGPSTIANARRVLTIASTVLDQLETEQLARN